MRLVLGLALAVIASGQTFPFPGPGQVASSGGGTTIYLASSGPPAAQVTSVSAGAPGVVNTATAHGITVGQVVYVGGVCGSDGAVTGQSAANGIRKVYSVPTTTSFGIASLAGVPITTTASVNCDPVSGSPGVAWVALITPYTLGSQPLGFLDGANGTQMRKLALTTLNGLTSLTVNSSHVAHAVTSYNHGISNGDNLAVWNSGNSTLNNGGGYGCGQPSCTVSAYQAQNVAATTFDFAVPSSVPAGTYSGVNNNCGPAATPNGTIGNTQDCLVVSQLAYVGSPFWDGINYYTNYEVNIQSGNAYKYVMDSGGTMAPDGSQTDPLYLGNIASYRFLVDRSNVQMQSILHYYFTGFYKTFGASWWTLEGPAGGVNAGGNGGGAINATSAVAWIYMVEAPYESSAQVTATNNMLYNDLWDPSTTACTKSNNDLTSGHNKILNTGTATAGGGTSITLASSASLSDGYYVNNIIGLTSTGTVSGAGGNQSLGLVTGYAGATRVATVASWSNGNPSNGSTYAVYATVTISSTTGKSAATITGYNTTFQSDSLASGDAIFGLNTWSQGDSEPEYYAMSFVTASPSSQTSAAVANSAYVTTSSTPQIYWFQHVFNPSTDCSMHWDTNHWGAVSGAQPLLYPPSGGFLTLTNGAPGQGVNVGALLASWNEALDLSAAGYSEPRAVTDLAERESYSFNYDIQHYMDYVTGTAHSGGFYTWQNIMPWNALETAVLSQSVPTFPSLDQTGPWQQTTSLGKIFSILPDYQWDPSYGIRTARTVPFGSQTSPRYPIDYVLGGPWTMDGAFAWAPNSSNAKYLADWLKTSQTKNLWGFWGSNSAALGWELLQNDPRIVPSDFTAQPRQYLFRATSAAACASLTGWPCPTLLRGDTVVSRTAWSRYNDTQTAGPSATYLQYMSRTYYYEHDVPQNGALYLYRAGELLGPDNWPIGQAQGPTTDQTSQGMMLQVGPDNSTVVGAQYVQGGYSPIIRWSSANHGSWASAYGDQNSNYMCATSDLSGVYSTPSNYILRTVCDSKQSGGDQFILQWDTVSLTSAISGGIATHWHYPQITGSTATAYTPGNTTFSSGTVTELESGTADAYGDPTPNFGLVSKFLSPGTITVRDDGTNYSGNSGLCSGAACTHRVSVCAGSSCGSSVSVFESLAIHKVAQSLTDTSLTCTTQTPDANWFVAQCTGALSSMVFAGARGGMSYSTMAGFTSTHSGTAQYLISGLAAGSYTVTVGGTPVSGSPFTVASGDNSIEFVSAAGAVVLTTP